MTATHDLAVTHYPVADLRTYYRNPRQGNLGAIRDSLRVNAQFKPIVVNTGTYTQRPLEVLAGNHTLMAAREEGWEHIAVVTVDVDEDQATRIVASDNRTADLGSYDDRLLAELLDSLPDLDGTGYDPGDVDELLSKLQRDDGIDAGDADAQDVPDPTQQREITTQPGDVWTLGEHRLVCGDATEPAVWATLMDSTTGQLMWTDPPYGVSYVGKTADALTIDNDATGDEQLRSLLTSAFTTAREHIDAGGGVYCASPSEPNLITFGQVLRELEIYRQTLIWSKDRFVLGHGDHHYDYEPIFYGWYPGGSHTWHGGRDKTTTLRHDRPAASELHPTMKPVQLIADCLLNSSNVADVVVDPFAGSGSTLLAAETTDRACRGIELSPGYCDVIVWRWQQHTGRTAARNGTDTRIDLTDREGDDRA